MSLVNKAIELIQKGFHVFPLNGKLPFRGSHGCKDAVTNTHVTKQRWDRQPRANIGVATGQEQGIFVIDIDNKEGRTGGEEWELLINQYGNIDNLYEVMTPSGGKHLYFKYPNGTTIKNSQSEIAPFIDVRGDGGYVVGEGSVVEQGEYVAEVSNTDIPEPPEWLVDLILGKRNEKKERNADGYEVPDSIPKGARNEELHRLACSLFGKGLHPKTITDALRNERDHRCENPGEVSDQEIENIVRSVLGLETFSDYRKTSVVLNFPTGTPLSDTFNAEYINTVFNGNVLYCTETEQNMIWNGKYWSVDIDNSVYRNIMNLFKESHLKATADGDNELRKHFVKSLNASTLRNTISIMNKLVSHSIASFDDNKHLFNLNNGVYDLATHKLLEHNKDYKITKFASFNYDPAAQCPNWIKFIDKIFCSDKELINYVQEAVGYCMTGDTGHHAFFICHGSGANGKSTFMEILRKLIGDYSETIPAISLMEKKYDDVPHDIAQLNKCRFVVASESSSNKQLNEARIKELTGDSTIKVRHLFKSYFTMPITFKVWLQTNHKPTIRGTDHGIWRRIKMIPFNYRFKEEERINNFGERFLASELQGIFNWACEGLKRIQKQEQWKEPVAVSEATKQYRDEEDIIGEWLETECVLSEVCNTRFSELYNHFKDSSGYRFGKKTFKEYLTNRGYTITKGAGNNYFVNGIGISAQDNNERPY